MSMGASGWSCKWCKANQAESMIVTDIVRNLHSKAESDSILLRINRGKENGCTHGCQVLLSSSEPAAAAGPRSSAICFSKAVPAGTMLQHHHLGNHRGKHSPRRFN